MARFIGDQTKGSWMYESGTYASATGTTAQWPGLLQEVNIDEEINTNSARFVNGTTRNVEQFWDQAIDASFSMNGWVQDWRMLGFALGSIVSAGSPYTHTLKQVANDTTWAYTSGADAPFASFSLQTAKRFNPTGLNHVKTLNGAMVNTINLEWSQGAPITQTVNGIGQSVTYATGAAWTSTANTERPYLWSDTVMSIPSGTPIRHLKASTWAYNNNMVADHYVNGSKTIELPYAANADISWSITVDSNTDWSKTFYEQYYKGGSTFNAHIRTAKSAVRYLDLIMSGCKVTKMEDPDTFSGGQEQTIQIVPQDVVGTAVDDIATYTPW